MKDWVKKSVVYQIYPRSFCDSNKDGMGDIGGIITKLDYLKELGVNVLWLSPVYNSPQDDNGYDISDYYSIYPKFGTMEDMERLITEADSRGMKILMDLVINHTSDEHPWFMESRNKHSKYRNFYYWRPGKPGNQLPNNWTGFFGQKCWEFDEQSGEYYLHLFSKRQPDLNYNNPEVIEEIKKIMHFWLKKGIAGFRCDVINCIFKNTLDNGKKKLILTGSEHYLSTPGCHAVLQELNRDVLSHYDCFTVGEGAFITTECARLFTNEKEKELSMMLSFEHMAADEIFVKWISKKFNKKQFIDTIIKWQKEVPWNANYLENHDQPRSVSRFGDDGKYREQSAQMLATLLLTLRGTPYIYQGEEWGLKNINFPSMDSIRDVESINVDKLLQKYHFPAWLRWKMIKKKTRDHARSPLDWGKRSNPVDTSINNTIFTCYKELIALRKTEPALIDGTFRVIRNKRNLLVYERKNGQNRYIIILNFGHKYIKYENKFKGFIAFSNYERTVLPHIISPYEAIVLKV